MMRKQMSNDESGDELAAAFRIFDKVREYGAFSFIATCFVLPACLVAVVCVVRSSADAWAS